MTQETHAWRVRLRITTKAQHDLLMPALFEIDDINETWPKMEIYFSMTNYAIFMVACSLLPKPVDVTKLDVEIVDLKDEPERIHSRHMNPRPIKKLKIQP
jgi:hypothetical protein